MTITLKTVAAYLVLPKMPQAFLRMIAGVRSVFTFTQERTNRFARFLKIVNAYRLGKPVKDIENEFGCTRGTVLRYARMAGLPKRPKGVDPEIRRAVIVLYKSGRPIAEIEARLGVSQAYISKTAVEEGINRHQFVNHRRTQ